MRRSEPAEWLTDGADQAWLFDPGLLDAAPQMAIVWARTFHDVTPLPACFGRVTRFRDDTPQHLRMLFEVVPTANASTVRANIYFVDDEDRVVLLVESLEGIASAALNRLAGTHIPQEPLTAGGVA